MKKILKFKKSHINSILLAVILAFALKASLDYTYLVVISKFFANTGFIISFSLSKFIESYMLLGISTMILFLFFFKNKNPSRLVVLIHFTFVIIPILSLSGINASVLIPSFVYLTIFSFLVLILVTNNFPKIKLPKPSVKLLYILLAITAIITVYVYGYLIISGGLERLNFNFYKVYEVRQQLNLSRIPLMGYFLPWQGYIINMAVLIYALHKRYYFVVFLVIAAQILLFGMTNFKAFLLAPILVAGLAILPKKSNLLIYFTMAAFGVVFIAYLLFLMTEEIMIPSVFIRRLFFEPARIHFWYYDFFSKNPHIWLSNSIFSFIFEYPYDRPVTRVVSWAYMGRDAGANVGYLGDAYANFGLAGMVAFSAILGAFLRILDGVASALPPNFATALIAIPAMSLVNSALFTTMLTHGFILAILCLWLLSGQMTKEQNCNSSLQSQKAISMGIQE